MESDDRKFYARYAKLVAILFTSAVLAVNSTSHFMQFLWLFIMSITLMFIVLEVEG